MIDMLDSAQIEYEAEADDGTICIELVEGTICFCFDDGELLEIILDI
jgi:hypothetical protein